MGAVHRQSGAHLMKRDAVSLEDLAVLAKAVRKRAHAPYSRFKVGCALLTKSGKVYEGCNVENASFGATICAERGAVMQMVAGGDREITACAIVVPGNVPATPCGMCRQVLAEFGADFDMLLIGIGDDGKDVQARTRFAKLFPAAFRMSELANGQKAQKAARAAKAAKASTLGKPAKTKR